MASNDARFGRCDVCGEIIRVTSSRYDTWFRARCGCFDRTNTLLAREAASADAAVTSQRSLVKTALRWGWIVLRPT